MVHAHFSVSLALSRCARERNSLLIIMMVQVRGEDADQCGSIWMQRKCHIQFAMFDPAPLSKTKLVEFGAWRLRSLWNLTDVTQARSSSGG